MRCFGEARSSLGARLQWRRPHNTSAAFPNIGFVSTPQQDTSLVFRTLNLSESVILVTQNRLPPLRARESRRDALDFPRPTTTTTPPLTPGSHASDLPTSNQGVPTARRIACGEKKQAIEREQEVPAARQSTCDINPLRVESANPQLGTRLTSCQTTSRLGPKSRLLPPWSSRGVATGTASGQPMSVNLEPDSPSLAHSVGGLFPPSLAR